MAKKQDAVVENTPKLENQPQAEQQQAAPAPQAQQLPPLVIDLGQLQAQLLLAKGAVQEARAAYSKAGDHYQATVKHKAICQEHFDAGVAAMNVLTTGGAV